MQKKINLEKRNKVKGISLEEMFAESKFSILPAMIPWLSQSDED